MASLTWPGYDRLIAKLGKMTNPDLGPLMLKFEGIIREDNREGNLNGFDKDGIPYPGVTYRPVPPGPVKTTRAQRNNVPADRRGIFAGMGPHPAGGNNNLTPAQYRLLGGPPLAPRGPHSRIITNLATDSDTKKVDGAWTAWGYWKEVVSTKGVYFLPYLFRGQGRYGRIPARDPRGVRPAGKQKAVAAAKTFLQELFRNG